MDIDQDETGTARKTGDEWLLKGPLTYVPLPEVVCMCIYACVCAWCQCVNEPTCTCTCIMVLSTCVLVLGMHLTILDPTLIEGATAVVYLAENITASLA